jgi:hypothetical protein
MGERKRESNSPWIQGYQLSGGGWGKKESGTSRSPTGTVKLTSATTDCSCAFTPPKVSRNYPDDMEGHSMGNVQSVWWLLQGVCLCVGFLGGFETLFAYAGVMSMLALLAMTTWFGIDMGALVLVLGVFVVWRMLRAATDTATPGIWTSLPAQIPTLVVSVGAWSTVGALVTSTWNLSAWKALGATLSVQWCFGWTLIALAALQMFSSSLLLWYCGRSIPRSFSFK